MHDNDNIMPLSPHGCEALTFVDIIKTAGVWFLIVMSHTGCHMSLFILMRVDRKDIDKIFLAHCPQMAVAPQSVFIVGPDVQTNKQTSVTPSHPGETLRDKLWSCKISQLHLDNSIITQVTDVIWSGDYYLLHCSSRRQSKLYWTTQKLLFVAYIRDINH